MSEVWGLALRCAMLAALVILPGVGAVALINLAFPGHLPPLVQPAIAQAECAPTGPRPPWRKAMSKDEIPCSWKAPAKTTAHKGEALNSLNHQEKR